MSNEELEWEGVDPARGRPWSRVRQVGRGAYRVELGGVLRPGWMASLGMELSSRSISIERASGRRGPRGTWSAEVDLLRMPHGDDPLSLSYVDLACSGRIADTSQPLILDRYTLTDSVFHGGCIEFDFEAPDSLGLLGRVLAELTMLVLFPVMLRIETKADQVHDRLWLTGINAPPSSEALLRLQQRLARVTRTGDPLS